MKKRIGSLGPYLGIQPLLPEPPSQPSLILPYLQVELVQESIEEDGRLGEDGLHLCNWVGRFCGLAALGVTYVPLRNPSCDRSPYYVTPHVTVLRK